MPKQKQERSSRKNGMQGWPDLLSWFFDKPGDEGSVPHERFPQAEVNVQILEARCIGRMVSAHQDHALLIPDRHKAQRKDIA